MNRGARQSDSVRAVLVRATSRSRRECRQDSYRTNVTETTFFAHDAEPPTLMRQPKPGELLFEFEHGPDRYRFERRAGAGDLMEVHE
jgi:hypothetical protein